MNRDQSNPTTWSLTKFHLTLYFFSHQNEEIPKYENNSLHSKTCLPMKVLTSINHS